MFNQKLLTNLFNRLLWWKQSQPIKYQNILVIGNLDLEPTQKDKISPHSSLTYGQAQNVLKNGLKAIGKQIGKDFVISKVTNTNSMEPLFDDNTPVALEVINDKVLSEQPIVPGDIVIYEKIIYDTLYLIIHMVTKINDSGKSFYFEGVNNYFPDGWVSMDKIMYRLLGIIYSKQIRAND